MLIDKWATIEIKRLSDSIKEVIDGCCSDEFIIVSKLLFQDNAKCVQHSKVCAIYAGSYDETQIKLQYNDQSIFTRRDSGVFRLLSTLRSNPDVQIFI